jgi:hypothetical protein
MLRAGNTFVNAIARYPPQARLCTPSQGNARTFMLNEAWNCARPSRLLHLTEFLMILMMNRQRLRDDRIAKPDGLGAPLGPIRMTTDTAFDATNCATIDRGSPSLFLPLFHYPFCDAAKRA